uniref:Uncharacterized protein n=1 Tax=Anser brachyrhynchus TaxID=132585 RepID=A0A8B9C5H2_9AVES
VTPETKSQAPALPNTGRKTMFIVTTVQQKQGCDSHLASWTAMQLFRKSHSPLPQSPSLLYLSLFFSPLTPTNERNSHKISKLQLFFFLHCTLGNCSEYSA